MCSSPCSAPPEAWIEGGRISTWRSSRIPDTGWVLQVAGLVAAVAYAGWLSEPSDVVVLHTEPALVVRLNSADGPRVLKAHRRGTDPAVLAEQLALARLEEPFVAPL